MISYFAILVPLYYSYKPKRDIFVFVNASLCITFVHQYDLCPFNLFNSKFSKFEEWK